MRRVCLLFLFSSIGAAQTPSDSPVIARGVLLERDAPSPSGEFSVRVASNQVYRYRFDAKTYVERESRMIDVRRLEPGDKIEVVSDTVPGSVLRYARTIHVYEDPAPPPRSLTARARSYRAMTDRALPAGTLSYSGVVFRITPERLVLHTREGGDLSILLRKDTRFLDNGENVDADSVKVNMRVFVRAGKDLYDQVEAYQVIWGSILAPGPK
ncbi:MAG TPA: hypothetical protein VKU19_19680 [Bryobacteraceae bacterium]|nr:hypothetical protein [Bryobacteraceae bacterium]